MRGLDRLQSRWKILLPAVYEKMLAENLFDLASPGFLPLLDVRWLTLQRIAEFEFADWVMHGLVPFATQADGSVWAWWPAHAAPAGIPVVRSWRDSNTGEVYASNFEGFLYRQIVDEMTDPLVMDEMEGGQEGVRSVLRAKIGQLESYIPGGWIQTALAILNRPLPDDPEGNLGLLPHSEATAILRDAMPDKRVNLEFIQHWQDIRPLGPSGLCKSVTLFGTDLSTALITRTFAKFGTSEQSSLSIPFSKLKSLSEFTLLTNHALHGDLLFLARFYPISHYNREELAAVGLFKPPMISINCPVEGFNTLLSILRELLDAGPAIATCRGVEPLANLLSSDDPWGDLRWA